MKIFRNQLIDRPILSRNKISTLARIKSVIIDPETGKILSVAISKSKDKLISFSDLVWSADEKVFFVLDEDVIFDRKDLVRSDFILHEGSYFNKQKVVTESGKKLGQLNDFEIDITLGMLTQISVRKRILFFGIRRLIARKFILEVKPRKILVEDNEAYVKISQKKAAPVMAPPV